jgi:predicted Zn-dependent protease
VDTVNLSPDDHYRQDNLLSFLLITRKIIKNSMNDDKDMTYPSKVIFRAFLIILTCIFVECISSGQAIAYDKILRYRIGSIDTRFDLSRQEVSDAVHQAVLLWEKAVGHTIFKEDSHGDIRIDFVYDKRQAVTDSLKTISADIDDSKMSYDELMTRYEDMLVKVDQKKNAYISDNNSYLSALDAYQKEIDGSNQKALVSHDEFQRLKEKKHDLDSQLAKLQVKRTDLQKTVNDLNKIVRVISEIASSHNSQVMNYKNTRKDLSDEFYAGRYEMNIYGEKSITIYHVKDHDKLVRALAHELGHAQGLKHSSNPDSIMYYLNRSDSIKLLPEDILAMQARCSGN